MVATLQSEKAIDTSKIGPTYNKAGNIATTEQSGSSTTEQQYGMG